MKKLFKVLCFSALAASMITVSLAGCSGSNDVDSSSKQSKADGSSISSAVSSATEIKKDKIPYSVHPITDEVKADAVQALLEEKLGKVDSETGYELTYNVDGTVDYNGSTFYLVWMRWLVTDDDGGSAHSSRVSEFIVSDDLSTVYQADVDGTNINFETKNMI